MRGENPGTFYEQYKDYHKDINFHMANQIKNGYIHLSWIMQQQPNTILEVGAGSGIGCVTLKRLLPQCRVIASDIDLEICKSIARISEEADVNVEVKNFNLMSIPFPDQSIDVCFSIGVMEHLADFDTVKAGLREQLRVARIVVVAVPLIHWYLTGLTTHGDEFYMPKAAWLSVLSSVGCVLDFVCNGSPGEELVMTAIMTDSDDGEMRMSEKYCVKGFKKI